MFTNTIHTATLLNGLDEAHTAMQQLLSTASEDALHFKPAARSWCIAQIAEHVQLSANSVLKAMALKGNPAQRDPAEKIEELQQIFLDFDKQYKSPEFILPTKDIYIKAVLLTEFEQTYAALIQLLYRVDFEEMIDHPAFGNISKLEIAHFAWFHTERHLRQMNKCLQLYKQTRQQATHIELFKTNVNSKSEAATIISKLQQHYPFSKITIDLHDCDKILRIEGEQVQLSLVLNLLEKMGYAGSVFT
ncbi:DinB family protein [Lacibacter cauensis]|uniref:DinB family protein n=1 Tax=Lacibacter cauensis TaxID=510947 RepID=A0A562SGH7_9BACT|nr:DinB family protein [Lacibacter cauensis]TWI80243.1 DinB family protein [Lacibacter cauensis]